jgi:hemerythrin-like domain-containing protein
MDRRANLKLATTCSPSSADRVAGILREEHRTLRTVLSILERLLADIALRGTEPEFGLIASALYYIEDFPERVHHPKEDAHFFAAVRRRTNKLDAVLDRLQSEHIRTPQLIGRAQRELVHYQGGAPQGLERLRSCVAAYASLLHDHMRIEEGLLKDARTYLTEEDWAAIARAFESHQDPLTDATRDEFRRLRARILNLLPRKMRLDPETTTEMRAPIE